jgi:hypothetical protein
MKIILTALLAMILVPLASFGDSFESWTIGQGNDYVLGIAMASDTDGWAYLMASNLYHWDGQQWTYFGIPFASKDGKVSAGDKGFSHVLEYYDPTHIYLYLWSYGLFIYNGTSWVMFDPQPPLAIEDLKVINPDSIWAFGEGRRTCYWNGKEWKTYILPEDVSADCIGFGSAEEGWLGGVVGSMAHFYHGAWHTYGPITTGWIEHADFANNDYGMMVGLNTLLIYYQGSWEVHDTLPEIFADCYATNDEYIAIAVEYPQGIYLFHNNTIIKGHAADAPLYCVFATSPHSIWAGGENGYVCHWVWADMQPTSLGVIKAQFPPETDLSPNKMSTQTQNDCNPLCPQLEFE